MRKVQDQTFDAINDLKLAGPLHDVTLKNCTFVACHLAHTAKSPRERRHIKNVALIDCKATANTSIGNPVVEDVEVLNLQTSGLCIAWGAVYKHARFRGRCGKFMLNFEISEDLKKPFRKANEKFYSTVDWALDISEAEFVEFEARGVPADLIRRDPETQVVVRLNKVIATQHIWRKLDLRCNAIPFGLDNMIQFGFKDTVFVAPKRGKTFAEQLEGLRILQKEGIAEPD